jgi:D-hexose-6-phosphate mutarotase
MQTPQALQGFAISGQIQFVTRGDNFVVAEVTNDHATASIALQGAHVMTWAPKGQQPVIWMSPEAKLAPGKSIRGGVPVCWPWFGPHKDDASKPGHGYARTVPWQVVATRLLPNGETQLSFELVESDATRAQWPHATPVRAIITVGKQLTIELVTRNNEKTPVIIGEALHTYFQVSDLADMRIEGLSGVTFVDKVESSARKVQQGAITIGSEVDRVYLDTTQECVIVDAGYQRKIRIAKEGSRSTVVWNPWIEKAEKMGDLGKDGYRRMVCVESANAVDDVVSIAPGAEHTMKAVYSVEPL